MSENERQSAWSPDQTDAREGLLVDERVCAAGALSMHGFDCAADSAANEGDQFFRLDRDCSYGLGRDRAMDGDKLSAPHEANFAAVFVETSFEVLTFVPCR